MTKDKINDHEFWDLKHSISHFIVPRLRAYIDKVNQGELYSIPNWVKSEDVGKDLTQRELEKKWVKILEKIFFSFNYQVDPLRYEEMSPEEVHEKKEEGLKLFAKYFDHLWD